MIDLLTLSNFKCLISICIFFWNQQKVPEGDWYCSRCKPNQPMPRKKRKTFVYSDDENENEAEESTAVEEESEEDSDDDASALESLFSDSQ